MKKSSISIPVPCDQPWDEMSPNKLGAFCTSCSTTVVDFSLMSDIEVIDFLDKSKGPVCGQFKSKQLQSNIQTTVSNNQWSLNLKAVVLGASLLTFQPSFAGQSDLHSLPTHPINLILKDSIQTGDLHFLLVNSVSGDPVVFIKIIILGANDKVLTGNYSDFDGKGTVSLRNIDQSQIAKIKIEGPGYKTQEIAWADVKLKETNVIKVVEKEYRELKTLGMVLYPRNEE